MDLRDLLHALDLHSFIAFDFETTGLDPTEDKITEFAAARFHDGELVDSYETLVNPQKPIPQYISNITGITDEMVADAPTEDQIVKKILDFIADDAIVAHNIDFDISFLRKLKSAYLSDERIDNKLYDTLTLAQAFLFFLPNHQLGTVAEFFGHSRKEEHRALADTVNVGHIFIGLVKEICSYPLTVIQKILTVLKSHDVPNKELYINLANLLVKKNLLDSGFLASEIQKDTPSNVYIHEGLMKKLPDKATTVFGRDGNLEHAMVKENQETLRFEVRPNQIAYSDFISSVFLEGAIGIAEADTGLGKSLAYLFPALKFALENETTPTIVSCYTKNLQDQLFYQEVPKLAKALDLSFTAVVMKGRQNYVCRTRLGWLIEDSNKLLSRSEAQNLIPVIVWLHWTKTGDFDECPGFVNRNPIRLKSLIRSDLGFCTRTICKKQRGCFVAPLRKRSHSANLIVVNHSLLLSELTNQRILPTFSKVIIDEAHNLAKVAYEHFQISVSYQRIRDILNPVNPKSRSSKRLKGRINIIAQRHPDVGMLFSQLQDIVQRILEAGEQFFMDLSQRRQDYYDRRARYSQKKRYKDLHEHFGDHLIELENLLKALEFGINHVKKLDDTLDRIIDRKEEPEIIGIMERVTESLDEIFSTLTITAVEAGEGWVYWEEGTFVNGDLVLSLNAVPIDIGRTLVKIAFKPLEAIVATSATLSIVGDFDYLLSRLGIDNFTEKPIHTETFPSPFVYDEQCRYFQWSGAADQKSLDFPSVLSDVIERVYKKWQKRTMVLFTSRKALEDCYNELMSRKFPQKSDVFAQLTSSSRTSLLRGFKNSAKGVLLGTSSFWEGVDLPKDLLEILIVTKLPFDVPTDPLIQAYSEKLETEGRNSFMEFSVPEAAIRLRQGFGRLIRSSYDEGIFINMDNRVVRSKYGPYFQEAIPVTMRVFYSSEEL